MCRRLFRESGSSARRGRGLGALCLVPLVVPVLVALWDGIGPMTPELATWLAIPVPPDLCLKQANTSIAKEEDAAMSRMRIDAQAQPLAPRTNACRSTPSHHEPHTFADRLHLDDTNTMTSNVLARFNSFSICSS